MELVWVFTLHQTIGILIGLVLVYTIITVINNNRQTDDE